MLLGSFRPRRLLFCSFNTLPAISTLARRLPELLAFIPLDSCVALEGRSENVVLVACVQIRETNPPRTGYDLRGACKGSEAPRRSAQCRPSDGRKPFRPRHSVASCGRSRREIADP